jgi:hypothetical protein
MVERKNKGKKVDDGQAQVSCHLKNSTKTCFLGAKSPQTTAQRAKREFCSLKKVKKTVEGKI